MPSQVSHQVQLLLPSQIPPDPITDVTTEIIPKENQRNTPKQVEIKGQLQHCLTELDRLRKIRQFGLSTDETFAKIEKYETEKSKLNKSLKRLVNNAVHSRESRKKKKAKLEKVMQLIPSSNLVKEKPGPWPLESTQPDLLRTIADIVISQSAADDKRRCSTLYTCQTLADLHVALQDKGFSLSLSALYLRLMPRRWNSIEAKRHITTVPVKLMKAMGAPTYARSLILYCAGKVSNFAHM